MNPPPARPRVGLLAWAILAAVGTTVAVGGVGRLSRPDFDGAVIELMDGDADSSERRALLEQVASEGRERAVALGAVGPALHALGAALELGDRDAWDSALAVIRAEGWSSPFLPAGLGSGAGVAAPEASSARARADTFAHGVAPVRNLLLAFAAESFGDLDVARHRFEQARDSARLAHLPFVAERAEAGLSGR